MIQLLTTWAINYGLMTAGSTISVLIIGWILKKIPTDKFSIWAKKVGKAQGIAITVFFNKKLPKFWNGVIEPVLIDTINALGISWLSGFIEGLKTDDFSK